MEIQEQVSLKPHNTFGIDVKAEYFIEVKTEAELVELCEGSFLEGKRHLVIGSGSNILFTTDYNGVIIKNSIDGVVFKKSGKLVRVIAGGGVIWKDRKSVV